VSDIEGFRVTWPRTRSHLLLKTKTNELEKTISLIKLCGVQLNVPLKLLACLAVSTPDGVAASRMPSAARKLEAGRTGGALAKHNAYNNITGSGCAKVSGMGRQQTVHLRQTLSLVVMRQSWALSPSAGEKDQPGDEGGICKEQCPEHMSHAQKT
jgi:hypothetical protein